MADRLVEIFAPEERADRIGELIDQSETLWRLRVRGEEFAHFRFLTRAERIEAILDPIQDALWGAEGFRIFVTPVEATMPRPEMEVEKKQEDAGLDKTGEAAKANKNGDGAEKTKPNGWMSRISREELYEDLRSFARVTPVFIATVLLSTIVAAVGMVRDSAAVVIGAMVIAPLLGPNMALALGTTLADRTLTAQALRANGTGVTGALVVAALMGLVWPFNPETSEIASRTVISAGDIVLGLAAGAAGALAFTSGVAASLVGVMVAVALLPPTVAVGMLIGAGEFDRAANAALLLATNVICINLAAVATFASQGIKPRGWWEKEKGARMSRIAMAIWVALLLVVGGLIALATLRTG